MSLKKMLLGGALLTTLFVVGLALGAGPLGVSVVLASPAPQEEDVALESGRWSFISKVDNKCVDSGTMDYCDTDKDNVCKLGIKKDANGNVLEKKCQ
jgi:hypothetical protein